MDELIKDVIAAVNKMNGYTKKAGKDLKTMQSVLAAGNFTQLAGIFEKNTLKDSLGHLRLDEMYEQLKKAFNARVGHLRLDFDKQFLEACNQIGLNDVQGNSMDGFRIKGIITVKINFTKSLSEISTFVSSKKINTLNANKIVEKIKEEINRLFDRPFSPEEFLQNLYQVYEVLRKEPSSVVLLKDVYRQIWLGKQNQEFMETANPAKMTAYSLDQFSVDLGRLIEAKVRKLESGYECIISLGAGGINIYGRDGNFNSYKFIEFLQGGSNA